MVTSTSQVVGRGGAPHPASPAKREISLYALSRRPETGALAGTVLVFVFFSVIGGAQFLSIGGFASWLNVGAELGIIAIPVGVVMIVGELDLSVGSVVAASSMTVAIASGYWHVPVAVGIILGLLVGALTGLINGIITTRTKVPSFIVALGTNFGLAGLALGLARAITGTTNVSVKPDPISKTIFGTLIGGSFEVSIIWCVGVAIVVGWILHMTPWGNWVFAVGGDSDSARASGVPVTKLKISIFVSSGLAAALVGIIQTCLYNGAATSNGQSFVFNSIIAVVVGGVVLTGGYGSVAGIVFGTLTFSVVSQGIYYTGWSSDWAALILGILMLAAVLMNNTFRTLALASGRPKKTTRLLGKKTRHASSAD